MEKITKDYVVTCNKVENELIRTFLWEKAWKMCMGSSGEEDGYNIWLDENVKEVWGSTEEDDWVGERISAKEFIERFGENKLEPGKKATKFKVGDRVIDSYNGSGSVGTIVLTNEDNDSSLYGVDFGKFKDGPGRCSTEVYGKKVNCTHENNLTLTTEPKDNKEPQVGNLVEWKRQNIKGTGYLAKGEDGGEFTVEIVTGLSHLGWRRNQSILESYKSKATDTYWYVDSVKKIEEDSKPTTGFKPGDRVRHKGGDEEFIVKFVHGMEEYDRKEFLGAEKGMVLEGGMWEFQKGYVKVTPQSGDVVWHDDVGYGMDLVDEDKILEDLSAPDLFSKGLEEFDSCIGKEDDDEGWGGLCVVDKFNN